MNSKDLAIGILCTTGTILLVGLILLHAQTQPARAAGVGVETGDYVLAVGKVNTRTEVLYVIDTAVNGMNVYFFDFKSNALAITDQVNLGLWRAQAQGMGTAAPGRRP